MIVNYDALGWSVCEVHCLIIRTPCLSTTSQQHEPNQNNINLNSNFSARAFSVSHRQPWDRWWLGGVMIFFCLFDGGVGSYDMAMPLGAGTFAIVRWSVKSGSRRNIL